MAGPGVATPCSNRAETGSVGEVSANGFRGLRPDVPRRLAFGWLAIGVAAVGTACTVDTVRTAPEPESCQFTDWAGPVRYWCENEVGASLAPFGPVALSMRTRDVTASEDETVTVVGLQVTDDVLAVGGPGVNDVQIDGNLVAIRFDWIAGADGLIQIVTASQGSYQCDLADFSDDCERLPN